VKPALIAQLNEAYRQLPEGIFIAADPIGIPHRFARKEDIEWAALLAATLAWGQRTTILKKVNDLLERMEDAPHDFISHFKESDLSRFSTFVHRTFSGIDAQGLLRGLQWIAHQPGGLQGAFAAEPWQPAAAIEQFRNQVRVGAGDSFPHRHISSPAKGSAAKRLNMFLRWMVRKDGIDFGLWPYPPARLICPLDVHSGNTARRLGLLHRNANDWKAAEELTASLREADPEDPVKYDLVLFGLGAGIFPGHPLSLK
jgi:uncharacterized protein (TIGR02757 family)